MQFKRIVLMKYGVHASESIDSIMARKKKELAECGKFFWGYGGTICHPITQVVPFLQQDKNNDGVFLLLCRTPSKFKNIPQKADLYSADGVSWTKIPKGITVYGSKHALSCQSLIGCDFEIDLSSYIVGVGPSSGKRFSDYFRGRVDKGCGLLQNTEAKKETKRLHIDWYAQITGAYLLR